MIVFAFEFITGGGMAGRCLPPRLADEGDRMLRALVADLRAVPGIEVLIARDARLDPVCGASATIAVGSRDDPWVAYLEGTARSGAVWPIAPETDGVLERLTRLADAQGAVLLGSRPDAVATAASKTRTVEALSAAGVRAVRAYADPSCFPVVGGRWVVKPDDGAGCSEMSIVADWAAAAAALRARRGFIAQPWVDGTAASLSLVCARGEARVLGCNLQHIEIVDNAVFLRGVSAGACKVTRDHGRLAAGVAAAIPGLWGYVGVDLVVAADGPMVIEVNPRLTASYCQLGPALGINAARDVLCLAGIVPGREAGAGA